jgi:hypothetical protein
VCVLTIAVSARQTDRQRRVRAPRHKPTSTGYSVTSLALDAWAVVDCMWADRRVSRRAIGKGGGDLQPDIAVVGHSVEGMDARRTILQRHSGISFGAVVSTPLGRLCNMIRTTTVFILTNSGRRISI